MENCINEIDRPLAAPAVGDAIAADGVIIFHLERSFHRAVADVVIQIQNDVCLIRCGKGIFVKTAACGRGQFNGDFRGLEKYRVITGRRVFLVVRKLEE